MKLIFRLLRVRSYNSGHRHVYYKEKCHFKTSCENQDFKKITQYILKYLLGMLSRRKSVGKKKHGTSLQKIAFMNEEVDGRQAKANHR